MEFKDVKLKAYKKAVAGIDKMVDAYCKEHIVPLEAEVVGLKKELETLTNKIETIKIEGIKTAKEIDEFSNDRKRIKELEILIPTREEDLKHLLENIEVLRKNLLTKIKNDNLEDVKEEFAENMIEAQYKLYCALKEAENIHKETKELESILVGETHILREVGIDTFYTFGATGYKTVIAQSFQMRDLPVISQYTPAPPQHIADRYKKEKGV